MKYKTIYHAGPSWGNGRYFWGDDYIVAAAKYGGIQVLRPAKNPNTGKTYIGWECVLKTRLNRNGERTYHLNSIPNLVRIKKDKGMIVSREHAIKQMRSFSE